MVLLLLLVLLLHHPMLGLAQSSGSGCLQAKAQVRAPDWVGQPRLSPRGTGFSLGTAVGLTWGTPAFPIHP